MSDVIEKERTTPSKTDDGDHELFSHYVSKRELEEAIFNGRECTALCGKKWLPTKDAQRYPVCPECKEAYEKMEPGE